jgi:hypothetical protein
MAELVLQDFRDLLKEELGQVLSDEKRKMFGEPEVHLKKQERLWPWLESTCRFTGKIGKRRRNNAGT